MDPALTAAARALARGDALGALQHVALRDDPHALALRATALAQLGDLKRAKQLFARAARDFVVQDAVAHARCVVAQADVALAARELKLSDLTLVRAIELLRKHGDTRNASYAQLLRARHALWLGDLSGAAARLESLGRHTLPPYLQAVRALVDAEVQWRRVQPDAALQALEIATQAAREAAIPALAAEIAGARRRMREPVARSIKRGESAPLSLAQVAQLTDAHDLVVDGCRRVVHQGAHTISFETRPVLFGLARRLAEATPHEVTREELITLAFGMRRSNDSLRARLRVALGRLRSMLKPLAALKATPLGYALLPKRGSVQVLAPLQDAAEAQLLALLSDGEAWSTSALALALGESQRRVQRGLRTLEENAKARSLGRGRSQRWLCVPLTEIATHMLLPVPQPEL